MSGNHTPTPWRVDRDLQIRAAQAGPLSIAIATGGTYAGLSGSGRIDRDTMKANAEFIVTAVNSYASSQAEIERLRTALERLVEAADCMGWATNSSAADEAIADARAALSGSKE